MMPLRKLKDGHKLCNHFHAFLLRDESQTMRNVCKTDRKAYWISISNQRRDSAFYWGGWPLEFTSSFLLHRRCVFWVLTSDGLWRDDLWRTGSSAEFAAFQVPHARTYSNNNKDIWHLSDGLALHGDLSLCKQTRAEYGLTKTVRQKEDVLESNLWSLIFFCCDWRIKKHHHFKSRYCFRQKI